MARSVSAVEPAGPSDAALRFSPIASLHLFVSLLGEVEHATPDAPGAFYNRLAEAVCRLGAMQRAVVFVYDDVARRVRVVGSHLVDIELFDAKNPGIALWGTPVFRDGIRSLENANFFKQLRRRGLKADGFELPATPLREDLDTYAKAYGLPPATGEALKLQTKLIKEDGLGMWITRLALGKTRADSQKHRISWTDVIRAHDYIDKVALAEIEEPAVAA